jgi:hypothetical protein
LVPLPMAVAVAGAVRCGGAEIKVSAANGCSKEWPKPAQEQKIGRNG